MSDREPSSPKRRPLITVKGLLVLFVGLFMLVGALVYGGQWFLAKAGGDLVIRATAAFQQLVGIIPRTTMQSGSVVLEKSAIAEIAVTQRKMRTVVNYRQAWLGSTKVMVVKGDFIAKAGFDLNQSFRFSVNPDTREVTLDVSKPKVLSIDFKGMEVLYSGDGIINKLNPGDAAQVVGQLLSETRREAQNSDLLLEAMQQFEIRARDLLGGTASKVTVHFHDGPLPSAQPLP